MPARSPSHKQGSAWVAASRGSPAGATVPHPAAPFRFDGVSPRDMVRWTGPAAGAHNDHVFTTLLQEATP